MFSLCFILLIISTRDCLSQDEDGVYRGKFLGKLNSYHHQVSGDIYAVDEYTLLFVNFNYDGNGGDTFFWAGESNRPGPQGFIVPDEHRKTNVLNRYYNVDFTLTLPDGKQVTRIKWFAIYDIATQNTFGDVFIPGDFEAPTSQKVGPMIGVSNGVGSAIVEFRDSKTVYIPEFNYDGLGEEVYFWIGVGPQPSSKGEKVPDEYGYLDPIREYKKEDVTIEIPGDKTIFDIHWISIYDVAKQESLGSVLVPEGLNVPPSLVKVSGQKSSLPNCVQMHKDFQVGWEVFGSTINIQLIGQIDADDYMSFGVSGSDDKTQMLGADVAVAYYDGFRGFATDYNITDLAPCVQVLGQYKGVCRDDKIGFTDNNQIFTYTREGGVTTITYRRELVTHDAIDRPFKVDKPSYLVWAVGRLDHKKEPTFHNIYPKGDVLIHLGSKEPINTCFAFSKSDATLRPPWDKNEIFDGTLRSFTATIGPAGGRRGYQGMTGQPNSGLAWYINGLLAPELWLRRGLTYSFKVYGGNNPHSAEWYHPLIISVDSHGGFDQLSDAAQKNIRVLAGVEFTRRGRPRPTAVGPLCVGKHPKGRDRRLDDDFPTFKKFNRTLESRCEDGNPSVLEITPNTTWPEVVYYNSFTHSNMGWKIHVVDRYRRTSSLGLKIDCFSSTFYSCLALGVHFVHRLL